MTEGHVISDEVFGQIQNELSNNNHWIAYNTLSYFLEKSDMYFFNEKETADEFSDNNISEYDCYHVIYASSMADVLRQISYGENLDKQLSISISQKNNTMNEKNFDYLNKQIKFTGFGDGHSDELKDKLQKQTPEFTIFHQQDFGKDNTVATLQFKKSDDSDMYFFNRYNLLLKSQQQADSVKQTFYVSNKDDNITLKEAYNMMNGRAVHKELSTKEGEKYNAWLQLDFKTVDKNGNYETKKFHQNYGFDLDKTLAKHPLKELIDPSEKGRLMESLERGNPQSVTIQHEGREQKVFIEAAPQFKSLNFYDGNMKRVNTQTLYEKTGEEVTQKQEQGKKEVVKQDKGNDDDGEGPKQSQKKSRKKSQNIS